MFIDWLSKTGRPALRSVGTDRRCGLVVPAIVALGMLVPLASAEVTVCGYPQICWEHGDGSSSPVFFSQCLNGTGFCVQGGWTTEPCLEAFDLGAWSVFVTQHLGYASPWVGFSCTPPVGTDPCRVCTGGGNVTTYRALGAAHGAVVGAPGGQVDVHARKGQPDGILGGGAHVINGRFEMGPITGSNHGFLEVDCVGPIPSPFPNYATFHCPAGGEALYWFSIFVNGSETRPVPRLIRSNEIVEVPLFFEAPDLRSCPGNVHNPVNVASGNVWFDHVDARLPGIGPTIAFSRSYNSLDLAQDQYGAFGPGWNHSYERRITTYGTESVRLRGADGVAKYFADPNADGTFEAVAPPDDDSHLVRQPDGSFRWVFRRGGAEGYDPSGRLVRVEDSVGNATTLAYDGLGRLSTISDVGGRQLTLTYDGQTTRVSQLQGPAGLLATYAYQNGVLSGVTYPDSSDPDALPDGGYTFTYAPSGQLETVSDITTPARILEKHLYYADGRAQTSELADAVEKHTFVYEGDSTRVLTRRVAGEPEDETVYRYATFGGMRRVVKTEGPATCGACGSSASAQEWTYDEKARVTSTTDGDGNVTTYEYDPATGDLLSENRPLSEITSYTYFSDGRVHTKTAPNGAVTTWTYVAAGPETVTETIDATHTRSTTYGYTPLGQLASIQDPRGKVTLLQYDAFGDLIRVTDPLGSLTRDPNDHVTRFEHDSLGQQTAQITPLGNRSETTYNSRGQVLRARRFKEGGIPVDTVFEYDQGGRRTRVLDPLNRPTDYAYDAYGRLRTTTQPEVDGSRPVTTYEYDLMSNVRSIMDAESHTTVFEYDSYNRVWRVTYPGPELRQETFSYHPTGQLKTRTDRRGQVTSYTYDARGRLRNTGYGGLMPKVKREYYHSGPQMGFLREIEIPSQPGPQHIYWTYDLSGQVLTERSIRPDGSSSLVGYAYDAAGNRASLSLDGQGLVTYGYDDASRLDKIIRTGQVFDFDYDDDHRRTAMTYPNGTRTTYAYDALSRLTLQEAKLGAATIASSAYPTFDDAGNRQSKVHLEYGETYEYDPLDRLRHVLRGAIPTEDYSYDRVGNRLSSREHAGWQYNARNELQSYGPWTFTYDENGNTTGKTDGTDAWGYEWNPANQLTRVTKNGAEVARFAYDALGRRTEKVVAGVTTSYVYDGANILRTMIGGQVVQYTNGPNIDEPLVSEDAAGVLTYEHADGLGSEVKRTSATGTATLSRRYDAFGQPQTGGSISGPAFTGREWDSETGLYYYRARYYDPRVGRFLSEDPLGIGMGEVNRYPYVASAPVNSIDPSGLMAVSNAINVVRTPNLGPVCPPNTGGACTRARSALVCSCSGAGPDDDCAPGCRSRLSAKLIVEGTMYVYSGPFRLLPPAKDGRVVDASTAEAHEWYQHLDPAIAAVRAFVEPREVEYPNEAGCGQTCEFLRRVAPLIFRGALRNTQANE